MTFDSGQYYADLLPNAYLQTAGDIALLESGEAVGFRFQPVGGYRMGIWGVNGASFTLIDRESAGFIRPARQVRPDGTVIYPDGFFDTQTMAIKRINGLRDAAAGDWYLTADKLYNWDGTLRVSFNPPSNSFLTHPDAFGFSDLFLGARLSDGGFVGSVAMLFRPHNDRNVHAVIYNADGSVRRLLERFSWANDPEFDTWAFPGNRFVIETAGTVRSHFRLLDPNAGELFEDLGTHNDMLPNSDGSGAILFTGRARSSEAFAKTWGRASVIIHRSSEFGTHRLLSVSNLNSRGQFVGNYLGPIGNGVYRFTPVPEPMTMTSLAVGAFFLVRRKRHRCRSLVVDADRRICLRTEGVLAGSSTPQPPQS